MAEKTAVPSANVFAKPSNLTEIEAAALGTSWLTAYSLLFDAAGVKPGDSVLIQGAGGGVSTAAIQLAQAAGLEVFVTSREADKRAKALKLGAHAAFEIGARLPSKVDAVIESVGAATWSHSMKSVRPGGTIAICGATTGDQPGAELTRLFFQDIRVQITFDAQHGSLDYQHRTQLFYGDLTQNVCQVVSCEFLTDPHQTAGPCGLWCA